MNDKYVVEELPAFSKSVSTPERLFTVYRDSQISDDEAVAYISRFLSNRARRMPVNATKLPGIVILVVDKSDRVKGYNLPTPKQVNARIEAKARREERLKKRHSGE